MILSRGAPMFRSLVRTIAPKKSAQTVPVRFDHGHGHGHGSGWFYRDIPTPPKSEIVVAELMGGFMWWWVLWNSWHMWDHIVGEYEYPEPEKWTDDELGITPD